MSGEQPLDAAAELTALLRRCRTLVLATAGGNGEPLASYAPFLAAGGDLHVYLSRLSAHTPNLVRSAGTGTSVSVMLIEDESSASQVFARRRATLRCGVSIVSRDSDRCRVLMGEFRDRFGTIMDTLAPLADFTMFALTPLEANVVAGFGRAGTVPAGRLAAVLEAAR